MNHKLLCTLVIMAICLVVCVSSSESVLAAGTQYKVTASKLYVRKGPGTSYDALGTVSKGTVVTVTKESGSWGRITYKGSQGWICLNYATKVSQTTTTTQTAVKTTTTTEATVTKTTETAAPATTEYAGPATTEAAAPATTALQTSVASYRVTASALNMRSGPGTSYDVIKIIPGDAVVTVSTINADGWGKATYGGKTGWISMQYCAKVSSAQTTTQTESKVTTTEKVTVTTTESTQNPGTQQTSAVYKISADWLNVRKGPGSQYDRIDCLPAGTLLTITEISSNNWGKFTNNGVTGWVSLSYCVKVSSGGSSASGGTVPVTEQTTTSTTESSYSGGSSTQPKSLKQQIIENLPTNNGTWAVYVYDCVGGEETIIGNAKMQAASLIKLYIMGAVYENYEAMLGVCGESKLNELLYQMITVSDNDAANSLVKYLGTVNNTNGMNVINSFCASHGYTSTHMGRLLLASNKNDDNYTSVTDCGKFLWMVKYGGFSHSTEMYNLLKKQQRRHKIPSQLPAGVKVANKTGELDTVENDAGIIYDASNDVILVFMSQGLQDVGPAQKTIGSISKLIYLYYN